MTVDIPPRLCALLADDVRLTARTLEFANAARAILTDNKMPFFPAYTDHGIDHVNGVLATATRLIPDEVWNDKLLSAADSCVLISATVLHDLALHMRETGFAALIDEDTPFRPLDWFAAPHGRRPADAPWSELWHAYRAEAKHFTASKLDEILGEGHSGVPAVALSHELRISSWTEADYLLIGEFLRRHHARLSHEIAIYGFPGIHDYSLSDGGLPALEGLLPELSDLIGTTARSHNEDLRVMLDYLEYSHRGSKQPGGAFIVYLMGLLRIADFLQIDAPRAPLALLRLRHTSSRRSLDEWNKHGAVVPPLEWRNKDPRAIFVRVSSQHTLRTHLQLRALFTELQSEIDTTTAVLREVYPPGDLSKLTLSHYRVLSNIDEPALHAKLPFIPLRAVLASADDLFRLVITDLYGNVPVVAGRELLQNAVDAVRDRNRWETLGHQTLPATAVRALPADVVVQLCDEGDERFLLRVVDRGIGMTSQTIRDYFLQAGASRHALTPRDELPRRLALRWLHTGRFGIGAFAGFLLGDEIRVQTRHVDEERGISFVARLDDDLVELTHTPLPVGTEIEIPFGADALLTMLPRARVRYGRAIGGDSRLLTHRLTREFVGSLAQLFKLQTPTVQFELIDADGSESRIPYNAEIPPELSRLPHEWREIEVPGYDAIVWSPVSDEGDALDDRRRGWLAHNGMCVCKPGRPVTEETREYNWSSLAMDGMVKRPRVAVFDSRHLLRLSLTRYELVDPRLPWEPELLTAIGRDIVAFALAGGARRHPLGKGWGLMPLYTRTGWLPLLPGLLRQCVPGEILVSWRPSDGGLTDAEEAAKVFASTNSQAAWVDWPVRTTLGLESVAGYFAGGSDTLNRISIGIQTFESKTNSNEILSVAALPPVSGVITGVPGWTAEHRETVEGNPLFDELFMYTTRPQDARASALARVARDLALTMSEGVALTLFATSEGSGEKPPFTDNGVVVEAAASEVGDADPLSDVWIEAIASFLPRSQHERDVLATKMMRKDKGLGVMVEQWRDYLAADAERVERRRREIIAEIDIEEADDEDL